MDQPSRLEAAWACYAAGDRDAALALAREAALDDADPSAAAALGFFLYDAGALDDAVAVLRPARDRWPAHAALHWYLGWVLQRQGDLPAAAEALRQACEQDATLDEAAFSLAWCLHDLGELPQALAWSARALAARRTPQRLLQAGWLQQQSRNFDAAAALYGEALAQIDAGEPAFARLCTHLAQCLRALGQPGAARAALQRGLEAQPEQPDLLTESAWQWRAAGDAGAAAAVARELVRVSPDRAGAWYLLGLLQEELGQLQSADDSYARAHGLDVTHVEALLRRARLQRDWGRLDGARWLLELALRAAPGHPAAGDLLAQLLLDGSDTAAARRHLVPRLRGGAGTADRWRLLAAARVQRGRPASARGALARALRLEPGNVEALRMAGWLALEAGEPAEAVSLVRRLLQRVPDDTVAHLQAAFAFAADGQLHDAEAWAERAVARDPAQAEAWRALSDVRFRQGRLPEAAHAIAEALRLAPGRKDSLRHLGWVALAQQDYGRAQLAFLQALQGAPDDATLRLELAEARRRAGDLAQAQADAADLLAGRPQWGAAQLLQARVLAEGGPAAREQAAHWAQQASRVPAQAGEALQLLVELAALGSTRAAQQLRLVPPDALRKAWRDSIAVAVHRRGPTLLAGLARDAVAAFEEDTWFGAAALYVAALADGAGAGQLAWQAREWYRALKIRSGLSRLAWGERAGRPRRRPRVAYVASQLHQSLLRRVLAAHDPERVDVFVFTSRPLSGLPDSVRVAGLVPERLAEACAANEIDVVIDAGGLHPFEGQIEVLQAYARRLAPVQAAWLGAWGTAGGLFDVLLTDRAAVPRHQERHYEEEVVCLEGGQWCWDPPVAAPAPTSPPCRRHGVVTFGVVARSLRLGAGALRAFAAVLAATPGAMLRFIGHVASDGPLRAEVLSVMAGHGVAPARVQFDDFRPAAGFLHWCGEVDIVLDTFPGNGGLSLLDPLWMGVPVVTLAGGWAGARQGASLLTAIGVPQWIAEDEADFIRLAAGLASDREQLGAWRAELRARMQASPLLDGRRVAAQIEALCERPGEPVAAGGPPDRKAQVRRHADRALAAWLRVPRTIALPVPAAGEPPALSVVVVLFNQAGLSRRTLQALADQRGASFETVIIDNASGDRTGELLGRVTGARIVRNAVNLGFLRAANQGVSLARGRHVVLLNSDAFLQTGALQAALAAMEADSSIGALGGRIVLTDGGLQEAGNVIFRDGSAGGIGRGEDPFGHAARASRPTDYVSGVFLVTPRALWRMLGGFDDAYAPAYYEDTDYCLRVWQAGFRCVVDARVLVEHLEWGSAIGDAATQQMVRNREVFLARHGAWLARQPGPMALSLDGDRWRSPEDRPVRRPRVLILDNEVPHMFKGGGLPRARHLLQALEGWPVTLLPLWTLWDEWRSVYASVPRSVEVAVGHGLGGLEAYLERRRGVHDVLLVSRPPNLAAIAPLRARRPDLFAGMRLVYDAEALFALREIAMAGVRGRPFGRQAARDHVAAEVALAADASDVLVVSERDAGPFRAAGLRTHVLGHAIAVRRSAPDLAGRAGLLFVGALHPDTPNEDGLLWFVREVLPRLRERLGRAPRLAVVGVCQSPRVAALAGDDIHILGPQEALEPHYDAARVFVAPVRFAGGVPAKVIEAAAHGIPVVASALLVRQLGWRDGLDVQGARDAAAFAAGIARLLADDALWRRQQAAAWEQCAARYDPQLFGETLRDILSPPADGRVNT